MFNPLSANFTKWSNTLKQFVSNLGTNCLNVFDHFVKLALKGLIFLTSCNNYAVIKLATTITSTKPKLIPSY